MATRHKSRKKRKKPSIIKILGVIFIFAVLMLSLFALTNCNRQRNNDIAAKKTDTASTKKSSKLSNQKTKNNIKNTVSNNNVVASNSKPQVSESPAAKSNDATKNTLSDTKVSVHPARRVLTPKNVQTNNISPNQTKSNNSKKVLEAAENVEQKAAATPIQAQESQNHPPKIDEPKLAATANSTMEYSRGDITSKRIAITFDAGASSEPTAKILKTLAKHNIKCTFFLTGKWMEKNPSTTKKIASMGHEIGNHSYSHKQLTKLGAAEIAADTDKTNRIVNELTGLNTKPLYRVPFGARDKRVLTVLRDQGYKSIYWDLDSWDSVKKGITADEITNRVTSKIRNGSIVLMHCGSQATADALDNLLTKLIESGYIPVTVSELLNL